MRAFLFTLAFAAVHGATHDCNTFTIKQVTTVCPNGYELASLEYVDQCLPDICNKLPKYIFAKFADPHLMLVGSGFNTTCGPTQYSAPINALVCTPSNNTCAQLFVAANEKTCPFGTLLAPADTVESCTAQLCEGLEVNSAYHYADSTKMVVGRALNPSCGPVPNNATLSASNSLCAGSFF